jgi:hypothetical protein
MKSIQAKDEGKTSSKVFIKAEEFYFENYVF